MTTVVNKNRLQSKNMFCEQGARSAVFFDRFVKCFGQKWGILIRKEFESLITGLKIPREKGGNDYV